MFHLQMEEQPTFYDTKNNHEVYLETYKTEMCGD